MWCPDDLRLCCFVSCSKSETLPSMSFLSSSVFGILNVVCKYSCCGNVTTVLTFRDLNKLYTHVKPPRGPSITSQSCSLYRLSQKEEGYLFLATRRPLALNRPHSSSSRVECWKSSSETNANVYISYSKLKREFANWTWPLIKLL